MPSLSPKEDCLEPPGNGGERKKLDHIDTDLGFLESLQGGAPECAPVLLSTVRLEESSKVDEMWISQEAMPSRNCLLKSTGKKSMAKIEAGSHTSPTLDLSKCWAVRGTGHSRCARHGAKFSMNCFISLSQETWEEGGWTPFYSRGGWVTDRFTNTVGESKV